MILCSHIQSQLNNNFLMLENSNPTKVEAPQQHQSVDINELSIYPCCYQLAYHPKNQDSDNFSMNHTCLLEQPHKSKRQTKPIKITHNISQGNNKLTLHNRLQQITTVATVCSLCETVNQNTQDARIINCLNCKAMFCNRCHDLVHCKGKFMSHKKQPFTFTNSQNAFLCEVHHKHRDKVLKNKIVCGNCLVEQNQKDKGQSQTGIQNPETVLENIKFCESYVNEIYHNQANKISQIRQDCSKSYKDFLLRFQQNYRCNMQLLSVTETNLKNVMLSINSSFKKISDEVETIRLISSSTAIKLLTKFIFETRIHFIRESVSKIISKFDQFLLNSVCLHKPFDRENSELYVQQLLKSFTITKTCKTEEDGRMSNRSSYKHHQKASRTSSKPSSLRISNGKDVRCSSSFKKNETIYSKREQLFYGTEPEEQIHAKNQSSFHSRRHESQSSMKRKNMEKSVNNQDKTAKNNSSLFRQQKAKQLRNLQKAEYQDLNLNLRKLIINKKNTEPQQSQCEINQKRPEKTSLQKIENEVSKENKECIKDSKLNALSKQNEKSSITSASFLRNIQNNKHKGSARKNYFVNSAENLQPTKNSQTKYNEETTNIVTSNVFLRSPQNMPYDRKSCKKECMKPKITPDSRLNRKDYFENETSITSIQKSWSTKKQLFYEQSKSSKRNDSVIFDNLIAVSCERQSNVYQFNGQQTSEPQKPNLNERNVYKISNFTLPQDDKRLSNEKSCKKEALQNIQMIKSINLQVEQSQRTHIKYPQLNGQKYEAPKRISQKNHCKENHQNARNNNSKRTSSINKPLKDSANFPRGGKHVLQAKLQNKINIEGKGGGVKEKQTKRTDFMDMRQKMRKPNYLSSKLTNNIFATTSYPKNIDGSKSSQAK